MVGSGTVVGGGDVVGGFVVGVAVGTNEVDILEVMEGNTVLLDCPAAT